jgi:Flp pilus assembly pilin Flp
MGETNAADIGTERFRIAAFLPNPPQSTPAGDTIMNKLTTISRKLANDTKGATMVEYALMLFLILCVVAAIVRTLGKSTNKAVDDANTAITTQ